MIWELGAFGSYFVAFLSNLPIDPVEIYANCSDFINDFFSRFLILALV